MLRRTSAVLLAVLGVASVASAQNPAGFVLFGGQSEDAKAVAEDSLFVAPVTWPYFNENSIVSSDVRAWAIYHSFDSDVGIDNAKVYAVQARIALTKELQLVAYKDGYTDFSSGLEDGYNDVGAGLKWAFIQDYKNNFHMAVGAGYEFAFGDSTIDNDDEYRLWVSADKGFGPLHVGGTVNLRYGDDTSAASPLFADSTTLSIHARADYYLNKYVSPVVELNLLLPIDDNGGENFLSGADVANWASDEITCTLGLGVEVRPIEHLGLRGAYELPLTDDNDLFGWRVTFSAAYDF